MGDANGVLLVECPRCKVPAGEPCQTLHTGEVRWALHVQRIAAAEVAERSVAA